MISKTKIENNSNNNNEMKKLLMQQVTYCCVFTKNSERRFNLINQIERREKYLEVKSYNKHTVFNTIVLSTWQEFAATKL